MPKNTEHRERLTEMLTLVVKPSTRARIQEIADRNADGAYSKIVRKAVEDMLEAEDPRSDREIKKLGEAWLAAKNTQKDEDGHA
jgi:hypothetical protein